MTNLPTRKLLWSLPPNTPIFDKVWKATASRVLGTAHGVLAPVCPDDAQGWRIAPSAGSSLTLAEIGVDDPSALAVPGQTGGRGPTHYLPMLRYDHPEDRPGSTFSTSFELAAPPPLKLLPRAPPTSPVAAPVEEVQAALQHLRQQLGEDFRRQLISARLVDAPGTGTARQALAGAVTAEPSPSEANASFSCVFASCQYPAGMMDRLPANRAYQAMARHFAQYPGEMAALDKVLLLGDQVYTDATYGLLDPARLDDRYRIPYENLTSNTGPLGQLPLDFRPLLMMMPDDHELVDDWEPWGDGAKGERHKCGVAAYWARQRSTAPLKAGIRQIDEGPGWQLFMADTRTTREYRSDATLATATILGDVQTGELEKWLSTRPPDDLKVITSAAMLLPRTRLHIDEPLYLDGWLGYPLSFRKLVAQICEEQLRHVVFLSGDAHVACKAMVTVERNGCRPVEFESHHAPALYAPFPFANESQFNLVQGVDSFTFKHGQRTYRCTVTATLPAGLAQGFGLLQARRRGGKWSVDVRVIAA